MRDERAALAERIRALLGREASVREVPMFGGLCFLIEQRMIAGAFRDGDLLVRVDPGQSAELLALPGSREAEMGTGRSMGPSWLRVAATSLATDDELSAWLGRALAYHRQVRDIARGSDP